jgi:hypothetical protein
MAAWGVPMFLFAPGIGDSLFPLGALLVSIAILLLLSRGAARDSVQSKGIAIRLPPFIFWLASLPIMVAIVMLVLLLVARLMLAALTVVAV